jgi:uncharacterized glyoxalase superfamily protein PhnB
MSATATSFQLRSLAPVLIVDAVEPCLDFWVDQLAFSKENEVPGPDGKVLFASVKKDAVEIMYQTRASVTADSPDQAGDLSGHSTALFITVPTVADLDAIEARVKDAPSVKPRHETFYGSVEFYVREPGGNVVGFAAFK